MYCLPCLPYTFPRSNGASAFHCFETEELGSICQWPSKAKSKVRDDRVRTSLSQINQDFSLQRAIILFKLVILRGKALVPKEDQLSLVYGISKSQLRRAESSVVVTRGWGMQEMG